MATLSWKTVTPFLHVYSDYFQLDSFKALKQNNNSRWIGKFLADPKPH